MRARAAAVALIALGAAAQAAAQRSIDERRPFGGDAIRIFNMVGSVRVLGWAHDSIAVTGTVHEGAEPFYLGIAEGGAKIGVWDAKATKLPPSHLEVRVPADARVWVKTGAADITVGGVTGGLDLVSVTGSIQVTGRPAQLAAETMGGAIAASVDTRRASLKTAAGAIALRGAIEDADATTVTGPIDIAGGAIRSGRFETIEGRIVHRGGFAPGAALEFTSHSGDVEFALPPDAAAGFVVRTFEGAFDDGWGVDMRKSGSPAKGRELVFEIGGGGASVGVHGFRGAIILRRVAG